MSKGSCYCGAVEYETGDQKFSFVNCHCGDCRKFAGSAFASVLIVAADGFRVLKGEDALNPYESSPGTHRHFCKHCGCHLFAKTAHNPAIALVQAGTLDEDPGLQPQCHIWVKDKAPWYTIADSLPQFEGMPPTE